MAAHIHLIGSVHLDPRGMDRTNRALAIEQPSIITLEMSRDSYDYIISNTHQTDIDDCMRRLKRKKLVISILN